MRAYGYPNLLRAYYFLCKALSQPQCKLLVALVLSSALHAGIIFLTTAGQGAKIQGYPSLRQLQVSIAKISPPEKIVLLPQVQEQAKAKPETQLLNHEDKLPEPGGIVTAPEQHYYNLKELDVVPRALSLITPEYPESVPASVQGGVIRLQIKLDESGVVTEAIVLEARPPGYFEDSARKAFINARFTPGMKSGHAVRSLLTLQIHFVSPLSL